MSDPLADQVTTTVAGQGDQRPARRPPRGTARLLGRLLAPFRTPAYRWLGAALVATSFAQGMWVVGLVWQVIRSGGGPAQLSVVTTAGAVGVLLPALLAGVVADRVPQKLILLAVGGVEAAGMALVAAASLAGQGSVMLLAAVSFVAGMGMAFYYPAYSAWLPALVPEEDLHAVNGFEGMVRPTVAQALGPAAAGAVVGALSPGWALASAAGVAVVGVLLLARVPLTAVRRTFETAAEVHPVASALHDVREGFAYMVRTPWLLATLLFASLLVLCVLGPLEVLIPFLVKERLGGGPQDHAWVLAAFGIGGALGSLAVGSLPIPRRYLTWMNLGWGFGTLPFVVIGMTEHLWVVIACALVVGASWSAPMVLWGTLLQRRVPPHLLGRVASLDFMVSVSLMPVSMALAGPLAELVGLRTTFLLAGVIPPVAAVVAILWARLPADEVAHPL